MIKRSFLVLVALTFLLATTADADSVKWHYDASHSTVGFTVKHLGISKVRGSFSDVDASVKADSQTGKVHWVKATIGVNSVNTGIEKRDKHLKAPDFFDSKKHPTIQMTTKKITWSGNKLSGTATLSMRGVTKDVPFTGEYHGMQKVNFGEEQLRAGYSMSTTINRKDFGLAFSAFAEGVAVVSDDVVIEIEAEIIRTL